MHCLLGNKATCPAEESASWKELDDILRSCGRCGDSSSWPSSASPEERQALARKYFVAALAEWTNMHDLHRPFPLGRPSKEQACAHVEHEHSARESVACNKLFPRKRIDPGSEEIAEDPRRRQLFRLWLSRNCNFLNNFVPIVLLMMLSNMDFQATLTVDAVVEYMTKYMTKAGQGSLIHVMEHSFSLGIEKAKENNQGSGAAALRWCNLQSISEVKSQLETMHLIFGAPRFLSSRQFRDLYVRSEVRLAKSSEQIARAESKGESITSRSGHEVYIFRNTWSLPSTKALLQRHPLTQRLLWQEILLTLHEPISDSSSLPEHMDLLEVSWPRYLQLLS